eukprot:XP_001695262.1 predicted protein [Chlamydomonas reinhardtii]
MLRHQRSQQVQQRAGGPSRKLLGPSDKQQQASSSSGGPPPLVKLFQQQPSKRGQRPPVMRSCTGDVGRHKHLVLPWPLLWELSAEQRHGGQPVRTAVVFPAAAGAAEEEEEEDASAPRRPTQQHEQRLCCRIGPTGSHGALALQVPVSARMHMRPLLHVGLRPDLTLELALGPQPQEAAAEAAAGEGGGMWAAAGTVGGAGPLPPPPREPEPEPAELQAVWRLMLQVPAAQMQAAHALERRRAVLAAAAASPAAVPAADGGPALSRFRCSLRELAGRMEGAVEAVRDVLAEALGRLWRQQH